MELFKSVEKKMSVIFYTSVENFATGPWPYLLDHITIEIVFCKFWAVLILFYYIAEFKR